MEQTPEFKALQVKGYLQLLGELRGDDSDITTACVATRDGYEIASMSIANDQRKLAAMSSSMHALGDAITAEAQLGDCLNVIIESTTGKAVLLTIPDAARDKVLIVAARAETNLGMLLTATRTCCQKLAGVKM
jgi:predicted regulator of Ras-like GTPase activity (Roadblock/LC7/MglB family)